MHKPDPILIADNVTRKFSMTAVDVGTSRSNATASLH